MALSLWAGPSTANTIAQNVSWTIERDNPTGRYRVVAYGDSLYAGYQGSISEVAIWNAPNVAGEYASNAWNADIEIVRRAKSGAKARDVYNNKIVDDASYMQHRKTRIVTFEMCGNDALEARNDFAEQDDEDTCDYSGLDTALANCTRFVRKAMQFINENAHRKTRMKIVSNLYYPGYDDDDELSDCTDGQTGQPVNRQDAFLPYLARINWRTCNLARQNGFACADVFAQFMGSDYDSNNDGKTDSNALRIKRGESEAEYVDRITNTLRSTIRDPMMKFLNANKSITYIRSDDTHPTYHGDEVEVGPFGGSGGGQGPPRFQPDQYISPTKNPIWRRFGHERYGRTIALFNPDQP
ncbi:MAG TPA: hypothetical protein VEC57_15250 [Candidatus Limnocylindrales bacterium]|nr:hypothetical protein [Candidatus Limnocylindrales bacterium]